MCTVLRTNKIFTCSATALLFLLNSQLLLTKCACAENVLALEHVMKKTGFEWSQPSYFKLEKTT